MSEQPPPIGVPRLYPGPGLPILYPGECARAHLDPETVAHAISHGGCEILVTNWIVEPAPGWHAWYLRTRFRWFGRWARGKPKLELKASCRLVSPEDR